METSRAIIICNFKINYFYFKFYCRRNWQTREALTPRPGPRVYDRRKMAKGGRSGKEGWGGGRGTVNCAFRFPPPFLKETNAVCPSPFRILHFNFEKTLGMFEIPTKANNVNPVSFVSFLRFEGMIPFFM